MKLKGKVFKAVVATPTVGKSYLADTYEEFVDADEVRLFSKYVIPDNISRVELEKSKGNRTFEKRENFELLMYNKLNEAVNSNKILLCSPHRELKDFLIKNKIPYLFVFPKKSLKNHIKNRMITRSNNQEFIDSNDKMFVKFYEENKLEPYATVKYKLKKDEYLSDILEKAGLDFKLLHKK